MLKLRKRMGTSPNAELNTSEFEGSSADVAEIIGAVTSYPFLADKRLVIVKGLIAWLSRKGAGETGKKGVERLISELPNLPEWSRLILWEREKIADNNKVIKAGQSADNGFEKAFIVPKDTTQWIIKRAKDHYEAVIEPAAASALASVTTNDLRRADNELFKLVSYLNNERNITEADVALLTPYVAEANMFEMIDALAEGRGKVAAVMVQRLLEQQEDVFGLMGMVIRQFRLLLLTKEFLQGGGYPAQVAETLGIHRFSAEKLAKQSRLFDVEQLEIIFRTIHDYDVQIKTGRIEPRLAIDMLIAGLAR